MICNTCGTTQDLVIVKERVRRLCRKCRSESAINQYSKRQLSDRCGLCSELKPMSRTPYCYSCEYNRRRGIDFREMDPDFLIDVHKLVKRIDLFDGKLRNEDIISILMFWCDCSLWPTKYNGISSAGGQILMMFEDLRRLLKDDGVDHGVRGKSGRRPGSKNKKK